MATLEPQPLNTAVQGTPFSTAVAPPQPMAQTTAGNNMMQHTASPFPGTPAPMGATSYTGAVGQGQYTPTGDAASIVNNHLGTILGSNNALMRNAQTMGRENAAAMGLQNSSIAAGAAQRASLDYAMPLVGHAQDTFNQREHRGWQTGERLGSQEWQSGERGLDRTHEQAMQDSRQSWQSGENVLGREHDFGLQRDRQDWQSGEAALDRSWQSNEALRDRDWRSMEAQLDRSFTTEERKAVEQWQSGEAALSRDQQVLMANLQEEMNRAQRDWTAGQNQLDRDQQLTMAEVQNWLANESFMRDFNAQLATMPINNTANLLNFISQQAITNPEIYTPDVVSGMSEFFTTNSMDVLSRYFPNYFQNQGGA